MGRHLLAAAVIMADTALLVAGHWGALAFWAAPAYALAVTLVVVLRYRAPVAAFAVVLVFAMLTGAAFVLLLWTAYQAGRYVVSRPGRAVVIGAAFGGLGVQVATRPADPRTIPNVICAYLVFVALPLLIGRYLSQHRLLVSTLDRHNRRLRSEQVLLAERERLRERLRIARDMHDSLGHRLSLVSIQAAALEVSLPPRQRAPVRQLAVAASGAMDELYELVGALRGEDARSPGVEAIDEVVGEFRTAGVPVTLRRHGEPRPLSAAAGQAAYRVVEEGLTNAAKHAPERPVTVGVTWEPDALLVTVVNPLPSLGRPVVLGGGGRGLPGLTERAQAIGGCVDHRTSGGEFRLVAMLPVVPEDVTDEDDLPMAGGVRTAVLGFVTAALMFVVLPAGMLLGVG
jgi:signal transduction histidine kinase